jgi:hypothetical protein
LNQAPTSAKLSRYSRADDVAVPVSQYNVMPSSIWSRVSSVSDHARNFSTIHAHSPAGESFSAYPTVCGFVDICAEYPDSCASAWRKASSDVRSASVRATERSGATSGGTTWMPASREGNSCPRMVVTLVPQSLPAAPYRAYPRSAMSVSHARAMRRMPHPVSDGRSLNP